MSNEVPGLWVDVRLPPDKQSSKPGGLESRMVLVSQGEGQTGRAPKRGQPARLRPFLLSTAGSPCVLSLKPH